MFDRARPIADAVMFEGYLLYPYRASAAKNQIRWTFGALLPVGPAVPPGEERSFFEAAWLVVGARAELEVLVRFLQIVGAGPTQRGVVHEIALARAPVDATREQTFELAAGAVRGRVRISSSPAAEDCHRVTLRVDNETSCTAEELEQALARRDAGSHKLLASAHALVGVHRGTIASAIDPPVELAEAARGCVQTGVWPVLVGDPNERDLALISPIVLDDFPAIAKESQGDLFDATEIDELLTLRILTMTPEEQREMRETDPRAAALLDRVASLAPDQLARMHGAWRARVRIGDRVRLAPRRGADAMDILLAGRIATVAAVHVDFEERVHVAVTIDDDPGRDLGIEGRKPGHRFYFALDELERLDGGA